MFALALVSLVFTSAQAQKQLGGEHNIEVNLTPFAGFSSMSETDSTGNTSSTMFGGNVIDASTIKYRYFLDDDKALRVTLMLNTSSDVYTYMQSGEQYEGVGDDPGSPQLHLGTSSTGFGLGLGYEMHFDGTDNLSPYFGVEGYFSTSKRKDYMEHWGPTEVIHMNADSSIGEWETWTLYNEQSVNQFGLNLLFGADYYFNDAIYVGFEAGLGLGVTKVGAHTISASDKVAFNIQYNNAAVDADPNNSTADLDSYNGYMPFDAATFDIYNNGNDLPFILGTEDGGNYDENPFVGVQRYADDGPHPNLLSGFNFKNQFNSAIRIGFLFD